MNHFLFSNQNPYYNSDVRLSSDFFYLLIFCVIYKEKNFILIFVQNANINTCILLDYRDLTIDLFVLPSQEISW